MSFPKVFITLSVHIKLADERFNESQRIDILLGDNNFWNLILKGQISLHRNMHILNNTRLSWIISGLIPITPTMSYIWT